MAVIVATAGGAGAGGAFFGAAVAFFLFFCAASNFAFNRNRISVRCSSLAAFVAVFFAFVAVVNFVLVVCFLRRGGVTVVAVVAVVPARRFLVVATFFAFEILCCRRSLDHFELTSPLIALQ